MPQRSTGKASSDLGSTTRALAALISLLGQSEALFEVDKIKEQVTASELSTDLTFLPSAIIKDLPAVNNGDSHFDRNFYRVLQLLCNALQDARLALDEYVLCSVRMWGARALRRRLLDARDRIRHALTLYNLYCKAPCHLSDELAAPLHKMRISLEELECRSASNKREGRRLCSTRILKLVVKLRVYRTMAKSIIQNLSEDEVGEFCRAGGIQALVQLFDSSSSPSLPIIKLALTDLQLLASRSHDIKLSIIAAQGAIEQLASLMISSVAGESLQHVALETLRLLLKGVDPDEEDVARILTAQGVALWLVKQLGNTSPSVQANAAGILRTISAVEANRLPIANASSKTLTKLVMLFEVSSMTAQFCAGGALHNLCQDPSLRAKVAKTAGISKHLEALVEEESGAATAKKLQERPSASVVGWAVEALTGAQADTRLKGLAVLESAQVDLLAMAVSEGLLGRIGGLLDARKETKNGLLGALRVVEKIAMMEGHDVKIAKEGGMIAKLGALLAEGEAVEVRMAAGATIESLSFNGANGGTILGEVAEAVEMLAALLFVETAMVEAHGRVASALWNLANSNDSNRAVVACCHDGELPGRLVALLASPSALVQEKAAGTLMSLALHEPTAHKIASVPHVFPRLVRLLRATGSTLLHQNAAGALLNLSFDQAHAAKEIGHIPASLPSLIPLLTSVSMLVQQYAAGTIANLAIHPFLRGSILLLGAKPFLLSLLNSSSFDVRFQATRALDQLHLL